MDWLGCQTDYLLMLQNFRHLTNNVFDNFFIFITLFGEVFIPIAVICFLYWCVNKKTGFYILSGYLYCFMLNTFIKISACIYRPWIIEPELEPVAQAIPAATGYSFPSGHTAGVTSVFGGIALSFWKNKFLRYLCFIIILLVMFSRNYLGVHTPQDITAALIISFVILILNKKLLKWESNGRNRDLIIAGLTVPCCILLVLYSNCKAYPMDYVCGKLLFDPTPVKTEIFSRMGFILGAFSGRIIEKRYINFSAGIGSWHEKIVYYIIGMLLLSALAYLSKIFFVSIFDIKYGLFLSYLIISMFITCIYPLLMLSCRKKLNDFMSPKR